VRHCTRAAYTSLYITRLTRAALQIEPTASHDPLTAPSWAYTARKEDSQIEFISDHIKEQAALDFKRWLQRQNPLNLVVYTDRFHIMHLRHTAGAGWVICCIKVRG
jgi:hypothetical protein